MEIITSLISNLFSAVIPFVLLLGVLIFVHELGHFLVARWNGVRVEVFSLGFGKKILKYTKGDTTYALSLIPLGGYVKMYGEQTDDTISEEDKKVSFKHKNVWQRISIVLAGPLMNFFFAIFIFFVIGLIGEDHRKPVLGDIKEGTAAYEAGFRPGDRVLSVNGNSVISLEQVLRQLNISNNEDLSLNFRVEREGSHRQEELETTFKAVTNPNVLSRYDFVGQLEGFDAYTVGTSIGVKAGSVFGNLGVQTGSKIIEVNGMTTPNWRSLMAVLGSLNPQAETKFVIQAPEAKETAEINIAAGQVTSNTPEAFGFETSDLYLAAVVKGSPAEKAGLLKGDRLIQINESPIIFWEDVLTEIRSSDGKPAKFVVQRGTETLEKEIVPQMTAHMTMHGTEEKRYTIGIAPLVNFGMPEMIKVKAGGIFPSITKGIEKTWDVTVMTVLSFVRLFQGMISPKNIGGVISIGQAAHETYKMGLVQFLQMMAIISVNLFILNLLPIPVLDGGHLVFYTIEALKGTPLSMRKMEIAQQVGLTLLMSLMVFALFNDFTRVLGL